MNQHRISKVYLKKFSFKKLNPKTGSEEDAICYYDKGANDPILKYEFISKFTVEVDMFDTSIADPKHYRYFELLNANIENNYNFIINALTKAGSLSGKRIYQLNHFVANIFIRQEIIREKFLYPVLSSKVTRKKFYNEITMLHDEDHRNLLLMVYDEIDIDKPSLKDHVNLLSGEIWHYLFLIFSQFDHVFLKAPDSYSWFSSDNPVIVNNRDFDEAFMIAPQAEVYFPLSKEILLFMHNSRVSTDNPLRNIKKNKVTQVSFETFESVTSQIANSVLKYFILEKDYSGTDVRNSN